MSHEKNSASIIAHKRFSAKLHSSVIGREKRCAATAVVGEPREREPPLGHSATGTLRFVRTSARARRELGGKGRRKFAQVYNQAPISMLSSLPSTQGNVGPSSSAAVRSFFASTIPCLMISSRYACSSCCCVRRGMKHTWSRSLRLSAACGLTGMPCQMENGLFAGVS